LHILVAVVGILKGKLMFETANRPEVNADLEGLQKMLNKFDAWKKGKNVMLTIDNPDTTQTNMRRIRVSARDVWGSPNGK
jgi:hypothetical protein